MSSDPLAGYRRAPEVDEQELLEQEVAFLHRERSTDGVDFDLIRAVLRRDDLVRAIEASDSSMHRLATYAALRWHQAREIYENQSVVDSVAARSAHADARAAKVVFDWINMVLNDGKNAAQRIAFESEPEAGNG